MTGRVETPADLELPAVGWVRVVCHLCAQWVDVHETSRAWCTRHRGEPEMERIDGPQ